MLNPGDSFGDYKIIRLLGKGGMGSVFLLENDEGSEVAAKILDPATAGDHEARKRFLREAELALGVKHPNLVETFDVGEDPETGLCYILMEYVPGGSLADRIKMVRSIGDSVPSGYRRFVLPSARIGAIGFRIVLGPDLEKEKRDAARATKRRK